jgi:hypothetical protein
MKTILARLSLFVFIFGLFPTITLSGCGVRGSLYMPSVPEAPQKPSQPEPRDVFWKPETQKKSTAPDTK